MHTLALASQFTQFMQKCMLAARLCDVYNLNIIELAMCVSHVLDSQLLNGWTYGHENGRVCSRTRSHDSVIFSYFSD